MESIGSHHISLECERLLKSHCVCDHRRPYNEHGELFIDSLLNVSRISSAGPKHSMPSTNKQIGNSRPAGPQAVSAEVSRISWSGAGYSMRANSEGVPITQLGEGQKPLSAPIEEFGLRSGHSDIDHSTEGGTQTAAIDEHILGTLVQFFRALDRWAHEADGFVEGPAEGSQVSVHNEDTTGGCLVA
jgi:hypothetical protein